MTNGSEGGKRPLRRGYYTLQTDGSMVSSGHRSKGDPPGEAGIGAVLRDSNNVVVRRFSRAIGPGTNDVAEYEALIAGLQLAHDLGIERIRAYMDSEFVVDQMNGRSDVSEADLKLLHERAWALFGRFFQSQNQLDSSRVEQGGGPARK